MFYVSIFYLLLLDEPFAQDTERAEYSCLQENPTMDGHRGPHSLDHSCGSNFATHMFR